MYTHIVLLQKEKHEEKVIPTEYILYKNKITLY